MNAISTPPREDPMPQAWPAPRHLAVGRGHRMAWRTAGPADGEPWLLLHGGPGSGSQPGQLAPLDLARQRAIAPDQRGSGASRPRGGLLGNHTPALVADLEALREHLGVQRWAVLAGSWGTVLALAYARQHPQRVQRLVLRGAFGLSRREIGGLLLPTRHTAQRLGAEPCWPAQAGTPLPVALRRLAQLLQSGTPGVAGLRVLRRWGLLESALAERGLRRSARAAASGPSPALAAATRRAWAALRRRLRRARAQAHQPRRSLGDRLAWRKFRVQAHYLRHRGFVRAGELDRAVRALAQQGVPVDWVHGRCDAVCPPANSRRWAAAGGRLLLPSSGHLGHEPGMLAALRAVVRSGP
jgi:proline iminopeptidase